MTLLSFLIVEDDPVTAHALRLAVEESGYQVAGIARSGAKALSLFREKSPDFVILDIHLEGSMDGIEVGKEMNLIKKVPHIYLTEHFTHPDIKDTKPRYVMPKPYHESILKTNIDLIANEIFEQRAQGTLDEEVVQEVLLSNLRIYENELWIKQSAGKQMPFFKIFREDIICVESDNVYLCFCTRLKDTPFIITMKIKVFEQAIQSLPAWSHFVRIHRSYIVNKHFIEKRTKERVWLRQRCAHIDAMLPVSHPEVL